MVLSIGWASAHSARIDTIEALRPHLVRVGRGDKAESDGLFIRAEGVPMAVFMWERYPVLAGQAMATRRALDVSTNIIRIQYIVQTNTVIKWKTKNDVDRLKARKRNIFLSMVGIAGALGAGFALGWGLGKK